MSTLTVYPNKLIEEAEELRGFLGLQPKDPFEEFRKHPLEAFEKAVNDAVEKIESVNLGEGYLFDTLDRGFWANPKKFPSTVALREIRKWVIAAKTQYDDEFEPDSWSFFLSGGLTEEQIRNEQWVDYDEAFTAAAFLEEGIKRMPPASLNTH